MAAAEVGPEVLPILEKLTEIVKGLKTLKASGSPKLEDVQNLQEELDAIDSARVDGVFGGSLKEGKIPEGQAACMDAMDEAYDLANDLITHTAAMPESVKRVHDNLSGIKRKLLQLKADRSHSLEDVHHYQLMVDSVDSHRVQGVFGGSLTDNVIPPGQAQCSSLLFQCYELLHQLLATAHDMNGEMRGIYSTLLGIKRKLINMKAKHITHRSEDLHIFQLQLDAIDRDRVDGIFAGSPQTTIPAGQAQCATLLEQCYKLVQDLQASATDA